MNTAADFIKDLTTLPTDRLLILLALAAIGLAAFTVHAVVSLAKEKKGERR
jgi:hypothetical protein